MLSASMPYGMSPPSRLEQVVDERVKVGQTAERRHRHGEAEAVQDPDDDLDPVHRVGAEVRQVLVPGDRLAGHARQDLDDHVAYAGGQLLPAVGSPDHPDASVS